MEKKREPCRKRVNLQCPKWDFEEIIELNIVEIVLANFKQNNVFLITCIKMKAGASTVKHAQTPINVVAG